MPKNQVGVDQNQVRMDFGPYLAGNYRKILEFMLSDEPSLSSLVHLWIVNEW
ncbi:MAG: hypothetical protein HQK52_04665 [Oligoflexia bacterium]|nr:hypothetical protein [Oligoflexia bacterium]